MPHADPFRLRVLKAITVALKEVTPTAGYVTNLSNFDNAGVDTARVYRGRDEFGFNDPRPMVSILEHPRALDTLLTTVDTADTIGPWELLIQGFAQDDSDNPTDPAHTLAAEVVKRLAIEAHRTKSAHDREPNILGLGCDMPCIKPGGMKIGKPVVRPPDGEISDVAMFYLSVTLDLVENIERPFD